MTGIRDTIARPVRTAAQGGTGWLVVEFIDAFVYDMSDRQYGIAVALATVVLGYLQNVVENLSGVALLRDLPTKEVDVVEKDETGVIEYNNPILLILAVVGIVLLVLLIAGVL